MAAKAMAQKRKAVSSEAPSTKKPKISKPASKPKTKQLKSKSKQAVLAESDSDVDPESIEDQTAALLKGFESTSEADNDSDSSASDDDTTSKPLDLALLPDPTTSVSTTAPDVDQGPTVLYISRVPHGFHEAQMKSYFSQFGMLTHLRLARNRRTGRSRHFAFLAFADAGVARIVARTMDNYLLFGHVLKCRVVSGEDVARLGGLEGLFRGSGRRFKAVPWNAIERNRVRRTDREGWKRRVRTEEKRRSGRVAKLKELGYEFAAPQIRNVDDVPVKAVVAAEEPAALENGTVDTGAGVAIKQAGEPETEGITNPLAAKSDVKSVVKKSTKVNKSRT